VQNYEVARHKKQNQSRNQRSWLRMQSETDAEAAKITKQRLN
jgi:hypothetical protein